MVARSAAEVAHNAAPQNKSDFTVEIGTLVPRTQHCRRVADSYRHVFPHFRQPSLDRVVLCTLRRNSTSRVTATVSQQQDQAQQIHSATWFSFARMRDYCTGGITPRELQSDTRLGTCIPSSSKSSWQLLRNIQRASCNCMFPSDYTPSLGQSRRTTGTTTFDLRRFKKVGPNAVHLMVQSAYVLESNKPSPGGGRIHFHALLGHALRGTIPRRPP